LRIRRESAGFAIGRQVGVTLETGRLVSDLFRKSPQKAAVTGRVGGIARVTDRHPIDRDGVGSWRGKTGEHQGDQSNRRKKAETVHGNGSK